MDSLQALLSAHAQNACDVINIKISKLGGLSKAKQAGINVLHMFIFIPVQPTHQICSHVMTANLRQMSRTSSVVSRCVVMTGA